MRDSARLQGKWRDFHEFHCREDDERVLVCFIIVSHLFTKNNEMIKTIKKTALFSDPISRFSRAYRQSLANMDDKEMARLQGTGGGGKS
jgi:hypothetical protein